MLWTDIQATRATFSPDRLRSCIVTESSSDWRYAGLISSVTHGLHSKVPIYLLRNLAATEARKFLA